MNYDEDDFRHFFVHSLDLLCIAGFDGFFKRVNPAWQSMLGYTTEELMENPYLYFVHEDDVPATLAEAEKINTGESTIHFENRYRCKDGTYRWLQWRATPDVERQLIYAAARDISKRKTLEQQLTEVSKRYRAVLDGTEFTIISTDAQGVIQTFNAAAQRNLLYTKEEVIGKMTPEAFHDAAEIVRHAEALTLELGRRIEPGLEAFTTKARLGQIEETEWTYIRKDGSSFPGRASVTALWDEQGNLTGFMGVSRDITEHKLIERARKETEVRLQAILENTPAVVFMKDLDGRYLLVNRRYEELFHLSPEKIIGKTDLEVFPPDLARAFRVNDARVIAERRPLLLEEIAPHDDGPHTYVSVKFPVHDADGNLEAVGGIATDITERKRAEVQLRESQARLMLALNAAEIGDWELNLETHVMRRSLRNDQIFGYDEQAPEWNYDILQLEHVHPEDRSRVDQVFKESIAAGKDWDFECRIMQKDHTERHILARGGVFPDADGIGRRMLGMVVDITERKRAEVELLRSNLELEQFAYVASHDLQEPLRMITSYLQLLQKRCGPQLNEQAVEYVKVAIDGAQRMRTQIQDLLMLSRIGTRAKPLVPTESGTILAAVLGDLGLAIKERSALITHDALPWVHADALQLGQVFQNLIGNALKFNSSAPPKVHIGVRRIGRFWEFSVSDNGIGINAKFFDRIFVIFQRLHTREEYQGTGIGLALCKKIIDRLGGRIWVESKLGEGTKFFFTLRAADPP